jgi:CRP-like cAMP-binding protein
MNKICSMAEFSLSLTDLGLFQDFRETELPVLKLIFEWLRPQAGTRLFEQGDLAQFMYILVQGEVTIRFKPEDGPEMTVARVKAVLLQEGIVGWSSMVGSPTYTSSAECSTDCILIRARAEDLRSYCDINPQAGGRLLDRLATMIAERMSNTHSHVITLLEQGLGVQIARPVV